MLINWVQVRRNAPKLHVIFITSHNKPLKKTKKLEGGGNIKLLGHNFH